MKVDAAIYRRQDGEGIRIWAPRQGGYVGMHEWIGSPEPRGNITRSDGRGRDVCRALCCVGAPRLGSSGKIKDGYARAAITCAGHWDCVAVPCSGH